MTEFLQQIINGIGLGAIYALIALGYTMVFGVLKFINFAHGEIYMLGAFGGYFASIFLGLGTGTFPFFQLRSFITLEPGFLALIIVLLMAMMCSGLIGFIVERLCYRPLRQAPRINILITAVGVSLLFQNVGQLVFGSEPKFFPNIVSFPASYHWQGLDINPKQILVLALTFILMILLTLLIYKTRYGLGMRAASFNSDLARLMGIPVDRIISFTFVIGSSLAGAGGVLAGLTYPRIDPLMGVMFGLKAFVAAVVGGIGSIPGAVVGSLIMGIAESLVVGYVASTYRDALAFLLLILILLIKPTGIFGKRVMEKV